MNLDTSWLDKTASLDLSLVWEFRPFKRPQLYRSTESRSWGWRI